MYSTPHAVVPDGARPGSVAVSPPTVSAGRTMNALPPATTSQDNSSRDAAARDAAPQDDASQDAAPQDEASQAAAQLVAAAQATTQPVAASEFAPPPGEETELTLSRGEKSTGQILPIVDESFSTEGVILVCGLRGPSEEMRFNLVRRASERTIRKDLMSGRSPSRLYIEDFVKTLHWAFDYLERGDILDGWMYTTVELIAGLLLSGPAIPHEFEHDPDSRSDWGAEIVGRLNVLASQAVACESNILTVDDANRILCALRRFTGRASSAYPPMLVEFHTPECGFHRLQLDNGFWSICLRRGEIDTLVLNWDVAKATDSQNRPVPMAPFAPGHLVKVNGYLYRIAGVGISIGEVRREADARREAGARQEEAGARPRGRRSPRRGKRSPGGNCPPRGKRSPRDGRSPGGGRSRTHSGSIRRER